MGILKILISANRIVFGTREGVISFGNVARCVRAGDPLLEIGVARVQSWVLRKFLDNLNINFHLESDK
jgi:hypothetical protein